MLLHVTVEINAKTNKILFHLVYHFDMHKHEAWSWPKYKNKVFKTH